jgi:hypothetical protein
MLIPDPDFYPSRIPDLGSRIPDPKTATKERGEMLKKRIWANFQRIIEVFTQKLSLSSQKYGFWIWDPRSWIRKKPIPDPGSRGSKRHRIPDSNPHWLRPRNSSPPPAFGFIYEGAIGQPIKT